MRWLLALLLLISAGCGGDSDEVVVYTSVDPAYAEPIIDAFEQETGISVRLVVDTEATKSVGLAERLRAERDRPTCDVWWANEPFRTIRLADEDLFTAYTPADADSVPETLRDPDGLWHSTGLRLRVLAVSSGVEGVTKLSDLTRPEIGQRAVVARPTAGTTGSHVAAIYLVLGDVEADALFAGMHDAGVQIVAGNSYAAEAVARGEADFGLTDNDDVFAAQQRLSPDLQQVILDQGEGELGTLAMPTVVALTRKDRSDELDAAARKLVDYLVSRQVEDQLIELGYAAASVRDAGGEAGGVRLMKIDYRAVAEQLPVAIERATNLLETGRAE
ncbi:MAG: extracellular solute-binding protein [Planctomycetota bacterium]